MVNFGRYAATAASSLMSVAALSLAPSPALAQGNQPPPPPAALVCDVEETQPSELQRAFISLQNAMSTDTAGGARLLQVKDVMRHASTNIERGQNTPGRNYHMARALFLLSSVKSFPVVTTRAELGFLTSPGESVDIYVAMDSLFSAVEESNPSCVDEIQGYRFSQVWLELLTDAGKQLEAKNADSAEKLITRAQILERKTPYTWQMLASIATQRDQPEKALEMWQKTYDLAGSDTSVAEMKLQALYFMGEINLGQSTVKTGADSVAAAKEAASKFRQYLAEAPKHKDAPAARANLLQALVAAGDTAGIPSVYADLIANPTEYTSQDHLQAGVAAANAGRVPDAVRLFGNALANSPFDRDALYNLSVSMFGAKMFQEMIPPATRLVEVDPNNPDNFELLVFAYAMLESTEADVAKKKTFADSLSKYNPTYEKVKASHKVTYVIFHRLPTAAALTGIVRNESTVEKPFTLEFDFIDKSGSVVGQAETTVGPVKAGESINFEVKVDAPGVLAFKAKPIPIPPA